MSTSEHSNSTAAADNHPATTAPSEEARGQAKEKKSLFSETLILAALPVVAYAMAYRFEVGFCQEFRIPTFLIEIALTDVLGALGVLLSILVMYFLVIGFLYSRLLRRLSSSPFKRRAFSAAFFLVLLLAFIGLARPSMGELLSSVVVDLVLWGLLEILSPTITSGELANVITLRFHVLDLQLMLAVLCLVIVIEAPTVGRGMARRQMEFLVSASDGALVVLRQYGQKWIVGRLTNDHRDLLPEFRIVAPAAPNVDEGDAFQLKHIGPLRISHGDPGATTKRHSPAASTGDSGES